MGTPQIHGALGWIHAPLTEVHGGDHVPIIADVGRWVSQADDQMISNSQFCG